MHLFGREQQGLGCHRGAGPGGESPGVAGWLFLGCVSRGKWEAGMSGCPRSPEVPRRPKSSSFLPLSMRPLVLVAVRHPRFVVISSWPCNI